MTTKELAEFFKKNKFIKIDTVDYKMVMIEVETKNKIIPDYEMIQKITYETIAKQN